VHTNLSRWGCVINSNGHLEMDDCDLVSAAREHGTPVHVVSKRALSANCQEAPRSLGRTLEDVEVFYSYKTNCVPGVLRIIHEHGLGAEVISPYELWVALELGVPGNKIIYNGPHKSKDSLTTAIRNRAKLINIDSLTDLRNTLEVCRDHGLKANVGIRLRPSYGWSAQFGFSIETGEAQAGIRLIQEHEDYLELKGLHVHLGSQVTDVSLFRRALAQVLDFLRGTEASARKKLRYLDVGGGFGVPTVREIGGVERRLSGLVHRPFRPPDPTRCPGFTEFGTAIAEVLERYGGLFPRKGPTVVTEPGRAITSNTQVLLLGVHVVKERRVPIAILDGGKMNITSPTSFEYHAVLAASRMHERADRRYRLVGRTCTPSDIVYENAMLPSLEEGDIIALMDAGAYFTSFSTDFAFPRPPIVLLDNGTTTVLRRRETFEDVAVRDTLA
jgi:diaminopimelate decarboxylase